MSTSTSELEGKVALVTGGSSGIGRSVALRFAEEGAAVVVGDTDRDGGEETVKLIEEAGGTALFVDLDVSQPGTFGPAFAGVRAEFGRLDVANNNAGLSATGHRAHEHSLETWNRVCDINLRGVWLSMCHEIPFMLEAGAGSIINTASVAGVVGLKGSAPYAASKHGVIGLTKTAALDYAEAKIRVNAVCPGIVATPMLAASLEARGPGSDAFYLDRTPLGRLGDPVELANAVLWLASNRSSFVTGQALSVDGGWTTP